MLVSMILISGLVDVREDRQEELENMSDRSRRNIQKGL